MAYTSKQLSRLMVDKLRRTFGRDVSEATAADMFQACALVLRDIMSDNPGGDPGKDRPSPAPVRYIICPWSFWWAVPWKRTPTTWVFCPN